MIIIIGASSGIGKFLFDHYLGKKEQVIGTYLKKIPEKNTEYYYKLDSRNYIETEELLSKINARFDFKDIKLINCAGINYNSFAHKSSVEEWHNVIEVNLKGTFYIIRAILPYMREDNYGRIINFSSVVAQKPTHGVSSYAASKSGLWGLSKSVAIENASKNITINKINLGYAELGMINDVPDEYLKFILEQIPARRLCKGSEILSTVQYLNSNGYINGASIDLSGGLV